MSSSSSSSSSSSPSRARPKHKDDEDGKSSISPPVSATVSQKALAEDGLDLPGMLRQASALVHAGVLGIDEKDALKSALSSNALSAVDLRTVKLAFSKLKYV
jgi:hypothetical protein